MKQIWEKNLDWVQKSVQEENYRIIQLEMMLGLTDSHIQIQQELKITRE